MGNFYDSLFWREGDGLKLWQYRLMYSVLRYVYPDDKYIFLTEMRGYNDDAYEGLIASYEVSQTNSIVFNIEIIGTELSFFGSDLDDEENTICFSMNNNLEEDPSNVPWTQFNSILDKVKEWVKDNIPEEQPSPKDTLFKLTQHLQ